MVRDTSGLESPDDRRLVFQSALFIGGSKMLGDDVLTPWISEAITTIQDKGRVLW